MSKHTPQRRQQTRQTQQQFQRERALTDEQRRVFLEMMANNDMLDILVEKISDDDTREKNRSVARNIIQKAQNKTQEYLNTLFPSYSPTAKDKAYLHLNAQKDMVQFLADVATETPTEAERLTNWATRKTQAAHKAVEEYLHSLNHETLENSH